MMVCDILKYLCDQGNPLFLSLELSDIFTNFEILEAVCKWLIKMQPVHVWMGVN